VCGDQQGCTAVPVQLLTLTSDRVTAESSTKRVTPQMFVPHQGSGHR
jgi:hypothetical protein